MNQKIWAAALLSGLACLNAVACDTPVSVCDRDIGQAFGLIREGQPVPVLIDAAADPALRHVSRNFSADLERVAGRAPVPIGDVAQAKGEVVLIGVLGQSPLVDRLVAQRKIKVDDLTGQWEAYRQVVVERPFEGVRRALVIVGSDRRGAVFGTYDLSAKMGVSPWYWWADVPVVKKENVFITAGERRDQPKVKYRGFFINDEDPSLNTWVRTKFGGFNAKAYGAVFELMLRLKGNYLWPAMWAPKAFNADDPQNMVLADEMGVIMGTSHHEPMMLAHDEWARFKGGKWDYTSNAPKLREFWRGGISRMMSKNKGAPYESLVTIGMRGDGDEPMGEGTAIGLLERIVADQRDVIAQVTGKPAARTPQMWALYKEVQDYYDKGMKVPDDVLLLFADDNWGNVRRLPLQDRQRAGGFGVYYHFDYVGGPRNYKWLNTVQIEKTWQQMNLAYERGADDLWIVNVGDIKPLEFPISFFLDMAWNPQAMGVAAMTAYSRQWALANFGPAQADAIGSIITSYSKLAARRKPELVDARSFALGEASALSLDGGEFGRMVAQWEALEQQVATARKGLRPEQLDAFFQLIEHPVLALGNFYKLYYYVAWNRKLAAAGDGRANAFAELAEAAFRQDQLITDRYHALNGGKWAGMMLQTHIGYTSWQEPKEQVMPAVKRVASPEAHSISAVLQQLQNAGVDMAASSRSIVIEAPNFSRAFSAKGLSWTGIANLGHGLGAVTALPQGREPTNQADEVRLEYEVETAASADATLRLIMVPTLDTRHAGGVRLAVSMDDRPAQVLTLDLVPTGGPELTRQERDWAQAVRDSAATLRAVFKALPSGKHVIRIWRLDDNAVIQKLVLDLGAGKTAESSSQPAL